MPAVRPKFGAEILPGIIRRKAPATGRDICTVPCVMFSDVMSEIGKPVSFTRNSRLLELHLADVLAGRVARCTVDTASSSLYDGQLCTNS